MTKTALTSLPGRTAAALTAVAVGAALAAPLALAAPAQADVERSGALPGGGRYELSVDREDGRYEVSADLDDVAPGSRWALTLRQDGKRIARATLTADDEGDLGLDRDRPDTAGTDRFVLVVKQVGGTAKARTSVTR